MNYEELANIVQKKPATLAVFFSRHDLSIKSEKDIRFYFKYLCKGKRLESGKRDVSHLKQYQFTVSPSPLHRAREFVCMRSFVWDVNPRKLSMSALLEYVFSNGNFEDVREIMRIVGKEKVKHIFQKQIQRPRVNYRPATLHFFKHYFRLS
ncbi:hypothetical protein K9L63_01115 [Candidatus Gracilibacteria bacterium]|nr:hypothetical protein [Candidatus Gracilibacteria bacterium]